MTNIWRHKTYSDREVEAVKLSPENVDEVSKWCRGQIVQEFNALNHSEKYVGLNVPTFTGMARCSEGSYVVKTEMNDFIVRTPIAFETDYEKVS